MITPTPLKRIALLTAGLAVLGLLAGCKIPTFSGSQPPKPPTPTTQPAPTAPDTTEHAEKASQVVKEYLSALKAGEFATAHALLSKGSQAQHAPKTFEQQGKQGMPLFDLDSLKATVTGDTALVEVGLAEDSGTHGFHLIREGEAWKIVYRGGAPGMPYR
jgi:hypothetical protein